MKLYKVKARYWPHKDTNRGYHDAAVLIEAMDLDNARVVGFEAIMGGKFFGFDPKRVEVKEVASVALPLAL